jgi:hypothetical protein
MSAQVRSNREYKEAVMKEMKYEGWEIHPELVVNLPPPPLTEHVILR